MSVSAPSPFSRMPAPSGPIPRTPSPSNVAIGISNTPSSISSSSSVQAPSIFARAWDATVSFLEACWEWITSFFSSACSSCQDSPAAQTGPSNRSPSSTPLDLARARQLGRTLVIDNRNRLTSFLHDTDPDIPPAFDVAVVIKADDVVIDCITCHYENMGHPLVLREISNETSVLMSDAITHQNLQGRTRISISTAILIEQPSGAYNIRIVNDHHSLIAFEGGGGSSDYANLSPAESLHALEQLSTDDRFYSAIRDRLFPSV